MRQKRAQAAMEFLMTYGWAILAAVIVIAVLASLGVFSPESSVPNACTIAAPFGCDKNQVTASDSTDTISLIVRNGGGQDVTIGNFTIVGCGTDTTGYTLNDQTTQQVDVTCPVGVITEGNKFTGEILINYAAVGGAAGFTQTASGSVTVTGGA